MINLEGAGRLFGKAWAVRELSLSIPGGEVFGMLGPNGAGKTTTIRMMAGILRPTEGSVTVWGHDVWKTPVEARRITGYIPDRPFLYEKLTVREFLVFVASIYGLKKKVALEKTDSLLERFGIYEIGDILIEECSHGMRQRLAFASALVNDPLAVLIDEPFAGLDPFGVLLVKDVIRGIAAGGAAVFLATHSLHIAAELSDRVGLVKDGVLVALKSRADIARYEGGLEELFIRELGGDGK